MRFGLACLLISVAVGSTAQVTKSGTGFLLRAKYTKGQTNKYRITVKPKGAAGGTVEFPIAMKTVSVDSKGQGTLDLTIGPTKVNGESASEVQVTTTTMDAQCKAISGVGDGVSIPLPTNPVKVGGSWSSASPLTRVAPGAGAMTGTFTYRGIVKLASGNTAVLGVKLQSTGAPMTGSGTAYLDPLTCQTKHIDMVLTYVAPDGKGKKVKRDFVMRVEKL